MTLILLAMLAIVLLAGVIVVYVAYPHRGEDVPTAPWVGTAMRKGVDLLPTLDNVSETDDGSAAQTSRDAAGHESAATTEQRDSLRR